MDERGTLEGGCAMSRRRKAPRGDHGPVSVTYTLSELVEAVQAPCPIEANTLARASWMERGSACDHHFNGTIEDKQAGDRNAVETVLRLVREGWPRGVALMDSVAASLDVPAPVSIKRRARWMDAGDDLEMQRVYSGDLEHAWRRTVRSSGRGPARVRILVESIASATVEASEMRWRGVAALVLADLLTSAGYSVQVESVMEARGQYGDLQATYRPRCIVKSFEQPLDLPALAATTALPAFFRALWHAWHYTAAPVVINGPGFYVGEATAGKFDDGDGSAVFVACRSIASAATARAWIAATVAALEPVEAAA